MIIYSITVSVEAPIARQWLHWMQQEHIPEVMATGYFLESSMQQLLEPAPQEGTHTYNIQYTCRDLETFQKYEQTEADRLRKEHASKFGEQVVAFRTLLKKLPAS